jgi:putative transposase
VVGGGRAGWTKPSKRATEYSPGWSEAEPGDAVAMRNQNPGGVTQGGTTMAHSYTNLICHVVFSTKDRRRLITADLASRLHAYLAGGIKSEGGSPILINGTVDHIHILMKFRADRALSELLRAVKANSSKWDHGTFPAERSFAWQSGYSAFTVSQSQAERVRSYIERQEEHHRRATFEEELEVLLRMNGITLEPRGE